ncbi:hypothetical protein [Xanthomonas campestris]|uniref:hypothetical protein n=1 Tax=Xanthomonas campestris TaxID=339 RepID=UPI001E449348|nr:hypothetical protein [Xanthomonas campestris]MCC5074259.1 hypothetical protein [Xanthomonas campestris pv. plantaginis]
MPGVLDASLQVATALISAMSASEQEYEETLTGTLLGSLLASNTLLTLFTAHLDIPATQCWWGSYGKYRSEKSDTTEAGSGADFALLTLLDNGGARLAIFQAKRGERSGDKWIFDANRVPQKPKDANAPKRDSQMVVLAKTAERLAGLADPLGQSISTLEPIKASSAEEQQQIDSAGLNKFDWIHYLIYTGSGAKCLSLRHLSSAFFKELLGKRSKTEVFLGDNCVPFEEIVINGSGDDGQHWLEFTSAQTAIDALPMLIPLIPVVVGDATGKHGPTLEKYFSLNPLKLDLRAGPISEIVNSFSAEPDSPRWTPPRPN